MRAADAEIGFPQSMQKRDIGSLSRPQKAQETRGVTVRRVWPWSANIRTAKQGRQQTEPHYWTTYSTARAAPSPAVSFSGCCLSLIHISEPTRRTPISYAVFCLKKKK